MKVYGGGPMEDLAFAQLWNTLVKSGELEQTFGKISNSLSQFFDQIKAPRVCAYEYDDEGIYLVFLTQSFMAASAVTVWVRDDHRQTPSTYKLLRGCYEEVLSKFPAIIGVTKQDALLPEHERFGYTVVGQIPGIFDGDDGWIVSLTPESYHAANDARLARIAARRRAAGKR